MREDEHSFRITRAELVEVLVTFLSPTTFRVRILPLEPDTSALPEYVTTKSDESYPPVDVRVDAQPNEVTFNTSAAILKSVPGGSGPFAGAAQPRQGLDRRLGH